MNVRALKIPAATKLLPLLLLLLPAVAQAQLSFTTNDDAITITAYSSVTYGDLVTIPGTINGYPVTCIGTNAFNNNLHVGSVFIPSSVTNIEFEAFAFCTNMTSVTMSNGVISIGDDAFAECTSLGSVTIPDSVTSIEFQAFADCASLTNAIIGNGVTSIGGDAFANCPSLTSVTIPDNVTNIGSDAFAECTRLTNAIIGNGVTSIGDNTFEDCCSLTSVTIGTNVTGIGSYAFNQCTNLTSVTIPDSVTSIENDAFSFCASMTSVTIGSSVTDIELDAFADCTSLTNMTIPAGVTSIGHEAFYECPNLTGVYFQGNSPMPDDDLSVFSGDNNGIVYYQPGTTGWGAMFDGLPTWNPQAQSSGASFGVQNNQFGFNITGNSNLVVVVQACTNLANPVWQPVQTSTLTGGSFYFSDPQWTNYPERFYRLSSP